MCEPVEGLSIGRLTKLNLDSSLFNAAGAKNGSKYGWKADGIMGRFASSRLDQAAPFSDFLEGLHYQLCFHMFHIHLIT